MPAPATRPMLMPALKPCGAITSRQHPERAVEQRPQLGPLPVVEISRAATCRYGATIRCPLE